MDNFGHISFPDYFVQLEVVLLGRGANGLLVLKAVAKSSSEGVT